MMKISSIDRDLNTLLSSGFFVIPRFQRPYSWDKENVQDFWNDTIANREIDYFIGSFVVYKINNNVYGLVDGQQRLTTITMLLCALRDSYRSEGFDDLASGVHNIIERKDINNLSKYILQTETSFPYFQEYIQKWNKPEVTAEIRQEEKNLEQAYKLIKKLFGETTDSIKSDPSLSEDIKKEEINKKLTSIRDSILELKVIFVDLDNEDDAYIIFETLNTRGKDLSASDLVKNLLTRFLRPQNPDVDRVKITWARLLNIIENAPGEVSIDNYIQHYWVSKYEYTGSSKLYKSIRKNITRENSSHFLDDLERQSGNYRTIFEPTFKKWNNQENLICGSLEALNLFHVRQPIPLLLAILNLYSIKKITKKETALLLNVIENFVFKYTAVVTTQSTGGLSMMYSSYAIKANQISSEKDKNELIQNIKSNLKRLSPPYDEYHIALKQVIYTDSLTKQRKLVKYILSKFHQQLNPGITINYDLMTIEHLVPQSFIDKEGFDQQTIGSLGNLILVSSDINVKLENKRFSEKKKILLEKGIILDPVLMESDTWGIEQINRRFDYISNESFTKHWKL